MFRADAKALFAKYCLDIWLNLLTQIFSEGKKSVLSLRLPWEIIFILVFVTNYLISSQLLMDIIFGYPLIGQFGTTWQDILPKMCLLSYIYTITFAGCDVVLLS